MLIYRGLNTFVIAFEGQLYMILYLKSDLLANLLDVAYNVSGKAFPLQIFCYLNINRQDWLNTVTYCKILRKVLRNNEILRL